jgi:hypothetical protein
VKNVNGSAIEAVAAEDITMKTGGRLLIKEGVIALSGGVCKVRTAAMGEPANCNILIPPGTQSIAQGDIVEVHMRESLWLRDSD